MRLVFGQDGAQVALVEDQHAVEDLSAQGTQPARRGTVVLPKRLTSPSAWIA